MCQDDLAQAALLCLQVHAGTALLHRRIALCPCIQSPGSVLSLMCQDDLAQAALLCLQVHAGTALLHRRIALCPCIQSPGSVLSLMCQDDLAQAALLCLQVHACTAFLHRHTAHWTGSRMRTTIENNFDVPEQIHISHLLSPHHSAHKH